MSLPLPHGENIDNDAPLDPVLPVAEVELLAVHQLEDFLEYNER
jgi:hypothetical protein